MALELDRYPDIGYEVDLPVSADPDELRLLRKWEVAIGYRIFSAMRWGQLGEGHITARDPERLDHFWVLAHGIPFWAATIDNLSLVGPDGSVVEGATTGGINYAAHNIHWPILDARPDLVSAAHTHTPFGTPWSANVAPFQAISQESCVFVYDQSIYRGDDLEVATIGGGHAIAEAMGATRLCILRNHGLLTGGASPGEAVGLFVMAERVAEVHVKAADPQPITDDAATAVATTLGCDTIGWRVFQWLARDLVPDPSVVLG
jgi:ribulose-5-phosphate 4-epimerase/fuculose-1-phosphate aldolase